MSARRQPRPLLLTIAAATAVIIIACGSSAPSTVDDSSDGDLEQVFADALGSIWNTDFSKHSVDLAEFAPGGPAKDGIPALDEPKFDSIADGEEFLIDREPVIVLELNGDARAYRSPSSPDTRSPTTWWAGCRWR